MGSTGLRHRNEVTSSSGQGGLVERLLERIGNSIPSLLGMIGEQSHPEGIIAATWGRLPDWHPVFSLFIRGARRRACRFATMAKAGAVRCDAGGASTRGRHPPEPGQSRLRAKDVMASVLGLTILASAFLARGRISRVVRSAGAAGWAFFLVVSLLTLPSTYSEGTRTEWPEIAHDLGGPALYESAGAGFFDSGDAD